MNSRFYEVTKQIILTSHIVDLNYISFSKVIWDGLTEHQQKAVENAAIAAAEYGRGNQLKLETELATYLKEQGIRIYEPDLTAFRSRVQQMYQSSDYAANWPPGLLEKINAL